MSTAPGLSVVVPAHRAAHLLPDTLAALAASDLPREQWELIVVDDASHDSTAAIAATFADRVLSLPGAPRGPGHARNSGAAVASGSWLLFVDADVRVHPDALRRVAETVALRPDTVAVFGAYDARPSAAGFLSQYRNLLHRYVHVRDAGEADTFWAGLGAVRRDAFEAANGFDTIRYPRPQIEDIELGYRLRDRGGRILLDPTIQGTHLKRWTLLLMLRADVRDRGVPWMRLMLERRGRHVSTLNIGGAERAKVLAAGFALGAGLLALVTGWLVLLWLMPAIAVLLALWNAPTYRWFARERGAGFALGVIPLHLLYYAGNVIAAGWGIAWHGWDRMTRLGKPGAIPA